MNKSKVLFITDNFYKLAGSEKNIFEVATSLDPVRYETAVVALHDGCLVHLLREHGIEASNYSLGKIYSPKSLFALVSLYRYIRQRKYDIVVTYHESSDFFGCAVARLAGVPTVISSRRDMGYRLCKRHIRTYAVMNRLFDRIITVSDAVANIVFEKEHALWHKMVTIHNGVKLDNYPDRGRSLELRRSFDIPAGAVVVGMVAALRRIKCHDVFLKAAAEVVRAYPGTYFLIVGSADDEAYFSELEQLVGSLEIKKNVIFAHERADIPDILHMMDISVISSLNEGFSNTILESMACAKPVIATDTGGSPEAVIDGETGILVHPNDVGALARAMASLIGDAARRQALGSAARRAVEQRFTFIQMMEKLDGLFTQLIAQKDQKRRKGPRLSYPLLKAGGKRLLKQLFGCALICSGMLFMLHHSSVRFRGTRILAFHRVNDDARDPLDLSINTAHFENIVKHIMKSYNVISLERAYDLLRAKGGVAANDVVLTFDDGYSDIYFNAYPILKKYGIPATIFLSVGEIDTREPTWYDKLVNAFYATAQRDIDLSPFGMPVYRLHSVSDRAYAVTAVVGLIKKLPMAEERALKAYIFKTLNTPLPVSPMLTWAQINEMKQNGISFGNHGLTHTILTKFADDQLDREITESRKIIKDRSGIDVNFYAYPNGETGDYDDNVIAHISKAGFSAGLTLAPGVNRGGGLFKLKRYCVTRGMVSGVCGAFSKSIFEWELIKPDLLFWK